MQQPPKKFTQVAELSRIYLRFINVNDDKQLTGILSKILPSLLLVYMEDDLVDVAPQNSPKITQIEEIMSHLTTRVMYSKGAVQVPVPQLLEILNSEVFSSFANAAIRTIVSNRIHSFIKGYIELPDAMVEDCEMFKITLASLKSQTLPIFEKCKMFILFLHRLQVVYLDKNDPEGRRQLSDKLGVIFEADLSLKKVFIHFSLLLIIAMFPNWQNNLRPLFTGAIMEHYHVNRKLSEVQFVLSFEGAVISVIRQQELFKENKEYMPIVLIASVDSVSSFVKGTAQSLMKTLVLDTEDQDLSAFIYQMILGNFNMFFGANEDNMIQKAPFKVQQHLIQQLMRFPSACLQRPFNLTLVDHCLFNFQNVASLQSQGLDFVRQMLRSDESMNQATQEHLKHTLERVRTSSDPDTNFTEESRAMAYLLLAELASRNYHLVFGSEITLAIDAFDGLRARVDFCYIERKPVRMDDIVLTYMEAVNKFRDCFELNLRDEANRGLLSKFVEQYLQNEGKESDGEIVYILFLYLARLGGDKLNAAILHNSIILNTHTDIKIRKEALSQLDRFAKANNSEIQGILVPFLHSMKPYFKKYLITVMDVDNPAGLANALAPVMEVSSAEHISQEFIDKVAQMSKFAFDFYKREDSMDTRLDCKQDLEKLFLINFHESFSKIKADFTSAITMISEYLSEETEAPVLATFDAAKVVSKLAHGANCVNLEQKILGLRLIFQMLEKQSSQAESNLSLNRLFESQRYSDSLLVELPKGQEQRLSLIFRDTLYIRFCQDEAQKKQSILRFMTFASLSVTEKFSPNSMELQKIITSSMGLLAKNQPLGAALFMDTSNQAMQVDESSQQEEEKKYHPEQSQITVLALENIIERIKEAICNRTLDFNFRCHLLKNIADIYQHDGPKADLMATSLMDKLKDYDQTDFQHVLGKSLCNLWSISSKLASTCDTLIQQIEQKEGIELNVKRNFVVYLHQIITVEGQNNNDVKARLLSLQRIFLKFLFDKKESMQDIASKSLSIIYNLGDEETRRKLVDSLSGAFTGQTDFKDSANVQKELEEIKEEELPDQFRDLSSTEQRKKMKTFRDLTSVANQLGSKQLIYQFLEIHRSISHLKDVQSAAKGLSNIIMLDAQLKADLVKLAPNILLLTYDSNKDVSHTMRELWTVLIDVDKEQQVITDRWSEIYEEAFKNIKSTENPRNKLRSICAMTDLMGNRSWAEIQKNFRIIFLTALGSLDSESDAAKASCYQLAKVLKQITLRLGNVYTNGDEAELRQVLSTVIPMILDDCLKSGIQPVRWFGLDMLSEIVMTARSQNVAQKLKIKSKYERQLMFNYNSQQKIKEILNLYMERIIIEIIGNASAMIKAIGQINMLEQLAIQMGYIKEGGGNKAAAQKYGMSESEINDMRNKMTKESTHGEILSICREMMTPETFEKILQPLLQYAKTGHDITTKSSAVIFINDTVLQGRSDLISPKNSRIIARKMIEIYTQNTVQSCLEMKQSLQSLYAACLGTQMKILKEFPNTIKGLLDDLADLDPQLEIIKVLNLNEVLKGLPESMITDDNGRLIQRFIPNMFVNRFKNGDDSRIKSLSKRNWDSLIQTIPNLAKTTSSAIMLSVTQGFESTSYDDRTASAQALQELCTLITDSQLEDSSFQKAIEAIMTLINGKYFNDKERLVSCFAFLVSEDFIQSQDRMVQFLLIAVSQAVKVSGSYNDYKNVLIAAIGAVCSKTGIGSLSVELVQEIYDFLIVQLTECLEAIVAQEGAGMLAESKGIFFDFNEKREEDKATLKTVQEAYSAMPRLLSLTPSEEGSISMLQMLVEVSEDKFVRTNWLVRQAILICFQKLLEQRQDGQKGMISIGFGAVLVCKAAEYGEKYDQNLVYLSAICLLVAEQTASGGFLSEQKRQSFREAAEKLIQILQEKGNEFLIQNIDLIRRYNKTSVLVADAEMTTQ